MYRGGAPFSGGKEMSPVIKFKLKPFWLSWLLFIYASGYSESAIQKSFPSQLTDISGKKIDIKKLAAQHKLVVITMKSVTCPLCRQLLMKLKHVWPQYKKKNVRFIVISPGPAEVLKKIRMEAGLGIPFVEDVDQKVATSLKLKLKDGEMMPGLLLISEDLKITWEHMGRTYSDVGDKALYKKFIEQKWL